jgi:TatA/E family protein of Tat protein translocase
MFGIGIPELILILAVALIVIGPKKLPDVAKALGRAMGEFKRATRDFKASIDVDPDLTDLKDVRQAFNDLGHDVRSTVSGSPPPPGPAETGRPGADPSRRQSDPPPAAVPEAPASAPAAAGAPGDPAPPEDGGDRRNGEPAAEPPAADANSKTV